MRVLGHILVILLLLWFTEAYPASLRNLERLPKEARTPSLTGDAPARCPVLAMSPGEVDSYTPYTHLAGAAYCNFTNWSCGDHCDALPGMIIHATGGSRGKGIVPEWFVGYLPSLGAVMVVHQGTATYDLFLTVDLDIDLVPLASMASSSSSTTLTSGGGSPRPNVYGAFDRDILVHAGFAASQASSFPEVRTAVTDAVDLYNVTKVAVVGHSLGGAIALLDAIVLRQVLPDSIQIDVVTYGQPRVGNQAFADYIDTHLPNATRITNNLDPVPVVPALLLDYVHSSGEKHIDLDHSWWACSGQDNPSSHCSTGAVSDILIASVPDHYGPYNGIRIGTDFCLTEG